MSLKLYNSLTQEKVEFVPLRQDQIRMYVCGVTVYDDCHLGHARAAVVFDVVYRYLRSRFPKHQISYVRNFTDIDDKIIKKAEETGENWRELSTRYILAYQQEMGRLGVLSPTQEPKATEHIPEMIELVKTLEKNGYAYTAGGDVFFSVRRFKDYGQLSHKKIDELESGARIEVNEAKKDPLDFVLWKQAKPGEPQWDSPWGKGRPGWHLECSAMSMKYLGESFDLHGGGRDLIFPHHENEIAQSCGATGHREFARYWLHNGFVNINAEKMSKSLGNIRSIKVILDAWDPEVVRYFLLSAHYRSALDFTDEAMANAQSALTRFYETLDRLTRAPTGKESFAVDFTDILEHGLDDDLNTAHVIGHLFDLIRQINKLLDKKNYPDVKTRETIFAGINKVSQILGIFGSAPADFLARLKEKALARSSLSDQEIEQLIAERFSARKAKNWQRADEIRDQLAAAGITLKDNPDGTTSWRVGPA